MYSLRTCLALLTIAFGTAPFEAVLSPAEASFTAATDFAIAALRSPFLVLLPLLALDEEVTVLMPLLEEDFRLRAGPSD